MTLEAFKQTLAGLTKLEFCALKVAWRVSADSGHELGKVSDLKIPGFRAPLNESLFDSLQAKGIFVINHGLGLFAFTVGFAPAIKEFLAECKENPGRFDVLPLAERDENPHRPFPGNI